MKKILFPTDFFETANNAFTYACQVADAMNAQIDIVHIFNIPLIDAATIPYDEMEEIMEAKRNQIHTQMETMISDLSTNQTYHKKIIYGVFVATEIIDFTKNEDYNLIIMGMKGEHNRAEKRMGTVTTHLMMNSFCPVMAVPEKAKFKGIKAITFASDMEINDDFPIDEALDFANQVGAELEVVYVDKLVHGASHFMSVSESSHSMSVKEVECKSGLLSTKLLCNPSVTDGLDFYLQENPKDILGLYIPRRRLWERLFHSSTTKAMSFHTEIPLLVFQE